jgi:antagonist of KipI
MTLHVLDPGLFTLIVDQGRPGHRARGVPLGGAADRCALALGNALVGNPPNAAALEICSRGPLLRAECLAACVVYGAPFELATHGRRLVVGTTFTLSPGEELRIGGTSRGWRAYLCVRGGLQTRVVLDSRSADQSLQAGDSLHCNPSVIAGRFVLASLAWNREPTALRALDGPQADWFNGQGFFDRPFTIKPASNRMGLRLSGEPLDPPGRELTSEGVCPGAVQVAGDGQCIVLGVDGQTIGGYPKIAQVIAADVDKLAQLRPGDVIRFHRVSMEEAEMLYRHKQAELRYWTMRLRPGFLAS